MAHARGSLRLMTSTLQRRDVLWVVPGIVLAAGAGVLPPLMAKIIGAAFNAFTAFNPTNLPPAIVPQAAKDRFMHDIVRAIWELCALAAGTMVLSTGMISVWIVVGEKVARGWRLFVYSEMSKRGMKWYDVDLQENAGEEHGIGGVGAGGLMAKFAR